MAQNQNQVVTSHPSRRPVILLVDDDADTLEMYEIGLAGDGFAPVGIRDGASVALQVEALRPDAVVTDLQLQGTTGWSVMEAIKGLAAARPIPVVLLTGHASADIDERAQSLGCAAVLTKPCPPDELAVVLRRLLTAS
jgi:two-component system response regulator GlrR